MRASLPRCAAALGILLVAAPALVAQDPEALLREGIALRQRGQDAEALRRFEAAWAVRPSPTAAAQLGAAHQALGHWVEAERFLRRALADAADPWIQRNRAQLGAALELVARRVGTLDVVGPAGATVYVNHVAAGALPLDAPLRVAAGVVTVELRAEGYETATRRAVVEPGGATRESFDALVALDAGAPEPTRDVVDATAPDITSPLDAPTPDVASAAPLSPAAPPPAITRESSPLVGALLVGAGALAVGVAVGAFAAERRSASAFNAGCAIPPGDAVCQQLSDDFDAWRVGWAVTLPVGITLGAVGAWLLSRGAPTRRLAWGCAPAGASVVCGLRF